MKTVLSRHKISIFSVLSFVFIIVAISIACKKQTINEPEEAKAVTSSATIVVDAKSYFTQSILKSESDLILNNIRTNAIGKATQKTPKPLERMGKIKPLINWENCFETSIKDTKYLFIPLDENIKPFQNKDYEFFRYLIFYSTASGTKELSIVEVLSDPKASLATDHKKVAITALANKLSESSIPIGVLNASIIFYTKDYSRETSFHIDNGKWSIRRIFFRSDLEIRVK